eukprot:5286570-Prymnesium_polylepis.2
MHAVPAGFRDRVFDARGLPQSPRVIYERVAERARELALVAPFPQQKPVQEGAGTSGLCRHQSARRSRATLWCLDRCA